MYIRNLRRLVLQRSKQTKGYLMNIAYVRVSAADQNEDRQRCSLEPYHIERWYIEKASGKDHTGNDKGSQGALGGDEESGNIKVSGISVIPSFAITTF